MDFLRLLEGIRNPVLDSFFQWITYFGQEICILAVICLFYWCLDKRFAYRLGFIYFSAGLCIQTLKITFRIPRPWILDPEFHPVASAVPAATGYSFPSGHTQGGTCLFVPLALRSRKFWQKCLCILMFLAIGFSRMYLGVHTPKDVLTAMAVSLFFTAIIWKFGDSLLEENRYTKMISVILLILSCLTAFYALLLFRQNIIEVKYAADCCKAAGAGLGFAAGFYLERTYLNFCSRCRNVSHLLQRMTVGLLLTLVLKLTLKFFLGDTLFMELLQYFFVVLFVMYGYPFLFTKMKKTPLQ
ncbi:phosphatase PAP2 family protein [Faecalicatena sp. Marseille-Q4148]|nr:phosphatase PAP2 family protein [Faecalicatena sp. Marseille-Q4148]